jgi:hypothetical protein
MRTWTVPSLLSTLRDITCTPSSHGLKGKFQGKGHRAFRDWVDVFFPQPDKPQHKHSVWKQLYERGYINDFHEHLRKMPPRDAAHLHTHLGDIFGRLQCVPCSTPSTQTSVGQLWKTADEKIIFVANPLHYKIEQVAPRTRAGTTVFRVKASGDMINARLDKELDGVDVGAALRAQKRLKNAKRVQARRSVAQKNKRVPPKRNQKKDVQLEDEVEDTDHPVQLQSSATRAGRRIVLSSEGDAGTGYNRDDSSQGEDEDHDGGCRAAGSSTHKKSPAKRTTGRITLSPEVEDGDDMDGYNQDDSCMDDYLPSWEVLTRGNSGDDMDLDDETDSDEDYDMNGDEDQGSDGMDID